ncbi:hypothetical protein [Streptomyces sp. AC555_RSS877]|uniref:hypothetical protein n=1 Tax=Streptomyces sp. AC555_RSS877 TaxID=2823688 RepID=UPI0020B664F5|nr:hypothetical protein [Streptomyces sp. AC555_RSS877]
MTTTDTPAKRERDSAEGAEAVPPESYGIGTRLWSPRGRHRRPRPRKVLLAAGGLALAAGALNLLRLTPDAGVDGLATTEAEPRVDQEAGADRATHAAATVAAVVPGASPSATTVMGGPSALPTPGASLAPTTAAGSSRPTSTTTPQAPNPAVTAVPSTAPRPSTSGGRLPQPAPTPTPSRATTPPAPQPEQPEQPGRPDRTDGPGLCVPVIAVCVDPLAARHR